MTIEECEVRLQAEMAVSHKAEEDIGRFDEGTAKYYKGQADAFEIALDLLKKVDHDVTLKEVKEFCQKQGEDCDDDEDPCDYCPMAERYCDSDGITFMSCGEIADILPRDWAIASIQKRMKEVKHETQKAQ